MKYRKTNLKTEIIDNLSSSSVDDAYIKKVIESDKATSLTIKLFYGELYLSFLRGSDKAKDKLRLLLIRIASRCSKFQSLACYGDTQKKETKKIDVAVNPKWLKGVADKIFFAQQLYLNIKLQLSSNFSIDGKIITWRSGITNSTEYVHIDLETPLGKIIKKFMGSPNLVLLYKDYLNYSKKLGFENEEADLTLKTFIKNKIIFLEVDRLDIQLEELIKLQTNKSLKNKLIEINTQLSTLDNIPSAKDIKSIIVNMNKLYETDQPLILSNIENKNIINSKNLNLPNKLKRLFSLMSVTSKDYQVGRAFKQYFEEKYGLYKFVPIRKAIELTNFEHLIGKLKLIEENDNEYHSCISTWEKTWLTTLSKNCSKESITLTDDFIDKLSKILSRAADHVSPLKSFEFLYSYIEKDNLFVLPMQAVFPINSLNTKKTKISTISYFPNVYPFFMNNPKFFGENLFINQYVPHNGYSEANLGFILLPSGLRFCDDKGHILNVEWNSIMETKVLEEEDSINLLKSITNYINQLPFSALPPHFNQLHHIPEIKYKNICLAPEIWNLEEYELPLYFKYWKKKKQDVSVISQGNVMPFYRWHTDKALNVVKNITNITFCETLLPEADYAIQFIKEEKFGIAINENQKYKLCINKENKKILKGFALLLPNKDFDFYVAKIVERFKKYDNWYFIRYFDNDMASIRIRLLDTKELTSFLNELDKFSENFGCEVIESPYAIETNRFGTNKSMYNTLKEFSCETKNYFLLKDELISELNDLYKRVAIEIKFLECALLVTDKRTLTQIYSSREKSNRNRLVIDKVKMKYINQIDFPINMKKEIVNCLKSKYTDSINGFAYYYFSLIHLCQNRLLGSNEEDEKMSRKICKKVLSHYM